MLDENRQMTNKENAPPAVASTSADSTAAPSAPEKPIRKDLLKERLLSRIHDESSFLETSTSYENNITDPEYSMINRMMADFNLNHDSIIGQKRTPLKSLKIPDATAMPHSPMRFASPLKSNVSMKKLSFGVEDAGRSDPSADDTLEEMEYVLDRGLNYVPKRLREQLEQEQREKQQQQHSSSDSDDTKSTVKINEKVTNEESFSDENDENASIIENDENDENIENDENAEKKSEYIGVISDNDDDDDEDEDGVILIESSPECSFTTTTGHYRSTMESVENTFYTAKTDPNRKSTSSVSSGTLMNQSGNDSEDVIVLDDERDARDSGINRSASQQSLDEDDVSHRFSTDGMPHFNDTLERVEYFMAQAEKLAKQVRAPVKPLTPTVKTVPTKPMTPSVNALKTATPRSAKPLTPSIKPFTKVHTPNIKLHTPDVVSGKKLLPTSAKKPTARPMTPGKVDCFKRPPIAQTKSASKVPDARPESRIPMRKPPTSLQKIQFRHIASPIAAYIKHTPEVPLMKTVKAAKSLQQNSAFQVAGPSYDLDESVQSVESFSKKTPLPRKMYTSASQRQVIANFTQFCAIFL